MHLCNIILILFGNMKKLYADLFHILHYFNHASAIFLQNGIEFLIPVKMIQSKLRKNERHLQIFALHISLILIEKMIVKTDIKSITFNFDICHSTSAMMPNFSMKYKI